MCLASLLNLAGPDLIILIPLLVVLVVGGAGLIAVVKVMIKPSRSKSGSKPPPLPPDTFPPQPPKQS